MELFAYQVGETVEICTFLCYSQKLKRGQYRNEDIKMNNCGNDVFNRNDAVRSSGNEDFEYGVPAWL